MIGLIFFNLGWFWRRD